MAAAGVIHLDVRLHNVMVKINSEDQPSSSSDPPPPPLEILLIDWDSSSRIDYPVPDELLVAFNSDRQCRYPRDLPVATTAYHDYFLGQIREYLFAQAEPLLESGKEGKEEEKEWKRRRTH